VLVPARDSRRGRRGSRGRRFERRGQMASRTMRLDSAAASSAIEGIERARTTLWAIVVAIGAENAVHGGGACVKGVGLLTEAVSWAESRSRLRGGGGARLETVVERDCTMVLTTRGGAGRIGSE